MRQRPRTRPPLLSTSDILQNHADRYWRHDLFAQAFRERAIGDGSAWSSHPYVTDREMQGSEFFNDFQRAQDRFYFAGAIVYEGDAAIASLAFTGDGLADGDSITVDHLALGHVRGPADVPVPPTLPLLLGALTVLGLLRRPRQLSR